jgi:hypothetical protein
MAMTYSLLVVIEYSPKMSGEDWDEIELPPAQAAARREG